MCFFLLSDKTHFQYLRLIPFHLVHRGLDYFNPTQFQDSWRVISFPVSYGINPALGLLAWLLSKRKLGNQMLFSKTHMALGFALCTSTVRRFVSQCLALVQLSIISFDLKSSRLFNSSVSLKKRI